MSTQEKTIDGTLFTVEGYRWGYGASCKRGIRLAAKPEETPEEFLDRYKAALDALMRHEVSAVRAWCYAKGGQLDYEDPPPDPLSRAEVVD